MRFDVRRERNTPRYKRMRLEFLTKNPLCAGCERKGIVRAAEELDHIVPAKLAPDRFWDETNLQGLCKPCHYDKTKKENFEESEELAQWRERLKSL